MKPIKIERRVLATAFIYPETFDEFRSVSTWFDERRHKIIWNAMHVARNTQGKIDMMTVSGELERLGYLDDVGGVTYLSELLDSLGPNETPIAVVAEWRRNRDHNNCYGSAE
jgi:replicative DNA helicase